MGTQWWRSLLGGGGERRETVLCTGQSGTIDPRQTPRERDNRPKSDLGGAGDLLWSADTLCAYGGGDDLRPSNSFEAAIA